MKLVSKILTLGEGRKLKKHEAAVAKVNGFEPAMKALSDEGLATPSRWAASTDSST